MNAFFSPTETIILPCDPKGIEKAVQLIRKGYPVALPTETVYGLAADALSGEAVARIYQAKGRPSFNPLIVHVADRTQAEHIAEFNEDALALADKFWPGALTLVLPLKKEAKIASIVTAGLDKVAVRMPSHPVIRELLKICGCPLAAPSANKSGSISPTTALHVKDSLDGKIAAILDGGVSDKGIESTIISVEADEIKILRPGPITTEQIAAATHLPIVEYKANGQNPVAPGQMASHYAPSQPVRLDVSKKDEDEWHIGFGKITGDDNLSSSGDLTEAAANLFSALHKAEKSGYARIAIAPIPLNGIGKAINDRLGRAAAPRN
ncbi:MAG: L-threonylcarbamoyladenylate synthase [Zymomonas mobilis]